MHQINRAIAVLTFKSREHILSVGGTCSWALNRAHARKYDFAVCTRNANTRSAEGPESHGAAFLIGRISDVVTSPENPDRWLLQFSEYAEVAIPNTWGKGWRNPVRYTTLEDLGIDVNGLVFQPMPEPTPGSEVGTAQSGAASEEGGQPLKLTIAEAKEGLSAMFGVPVEAVEITIRA
ncbi:hypothetical protein EOB36_15955 [Mesorhizobium sp. M6A.T.Cr.TU.017.01.1.1]|nr:hypothetical protein EOB36_15955 [Mesorhizobium sp. M6A.T.Cr.TU.017.01.1.1]